MTDRATPAFGTRRPAVFFGLDGTLIEHVPGLRNPANVSLVPHASNAVRYINYVFVPVVVVTNQPGLARGTVTEADYEAVKAQIDNLLAERNAWIDATYVCPHDPAVSGACACRKPGTALFERAISDLRLDPGRCACIGDRWDDIVVARTLGGRGILVPSVQTPEDEIVRAKQEFEVVTTLTDAVHAIIGSPAPGADG